jgi:FMN phosphatase YigB (HAD superfamily)
VRIHHTWADACRAGGLAELADPPADVEAERRRLNALLGVGRITLDAWAARLSVALDGVHGPDALMRVHHAITRREYDGAGDLIDALHAASVATACLSNTDHAHWARLSHRDDDGLRPGSPEYPSVARLQRQFASHRLGMLKPDPAIYTEFERLTGVRGDDIVFFDDRSENIEVARQHGWRAHLVDAEPDPIAQMRAHLRAYSFSALPETGRAG